MRVERIDDEQTLLDWLRAFMTGDERRAVVLVPDSNLFSRLGAFTRHMALPRLFGYTGLNLGQGAGRFT